MGALGHRVLVHDRSFNGLYMLLLAGFPLDSDANVSSSFRDTNLDKDSDLVHGIEQRIPTQ